VTSGASVPEILVREVLDLLARHGFEDVTPVVAAEESLMFALPTDIRRDLKAAGMSDTMRHDASFAGSGSGLR
jgi:4-hydroxy-3-methylbut-2-en-1-yl diphosphate reductase